jgi:single-stranded DNA-specific DHH superfamily exonuclease
MEIGQNSTKLRNRLGKTHHKVLQTLEFLAMVHVGTLGDWQKLVGTNELLRTFWNRWKLLGNC